MLLALTVLVSLPAWTAQGVPHRDVKIGILQLPSDQRGKIIEAHGGWRVTTPAVLFTPAGDANIHGPAIVTLDTGPGAHRLEAGQTSRFAAERLAARRLHRAQPLRQAGA